MDFIAFEHRDFWFFVKPKDIKDLLDSNMSSNAEIQETKEIYTFYRRKGRLDLLVMVPNEDLVKIAVKIINKNKDE